MIIASDHATVYAGVVVADHAQQVVLLSMAGPRTAVKAIYAALRVEILMIFLQNHREL